MKTVIQTQHENDSITVDSGDVTIELRIGDAEGSRYAIMTPLQARDVACELLRHTDAMLNAAAARRQRSARP